MLNNDISELENHYSEYKNGYVLEFICQEPNTLADYTSHAKEIDESLESFNYYKPGDRIRPVNGKFDKIGYNAQNDFL